MKVHKKIFIGCLMLVAGMAFSLSSAVAATYESLDGLSGLEMVYDFRLENPQKAELFLELIHKTYQDKDLNQLGESPRLVVVINGAAVRLIAEDQQGFSSEDQVHLQNIASRLSAMAADGIRFEGCLVAARIFKVDPNLFLSSINKVNNAWISIAGYQAQQYSGLVIN